MKKIIAGFTAACALAIPAAASAGLGYGHAIQDCFGMNYGQAKNAAWSMGHAAKPALGAKQTALAHGCVVDR